MHVGSLLPDPRIPSNQPQSDFMLPDVGGFGGGGKGQTGRLESSRQAFMAVLVSFFGELNQTEVALSREKSLSRFILNSDLVRFDLDWDCSKGVLNPLTSV